MIAPDLRQQNGTPDRQQREPTAGWQSGSAPHAAAASPSPAVPPVQGLPPVPGVERGAAAFRAVGSAIHGARREYPLALLITAAAVVGLTAGWLVKRR